MAGNSNSGGNGKSGKNEIAPQIRGAFLRALEIYKKKHGKTFPEAMAEWMESNPIALLNAVSKFEVRHAKLEGSIKHDHKHEHKSVSETLAFIDEVIGDGKEGSSKESLPN